MLRACEECADRLKLAEARAVVLEERLRLKDELLGLKDQIIGVLTQQRDDYRSASETRARVGTIDDQRLVLCRDQNASDRLLIDRQDREISRLRNPSLLRQLFSVDSLFKLGAGFALGRITSQ